MRGNVVVKSWVGVSGRCPISCYVNDGESVDFRFGNPPNDFEFGFGEESLRKFLAMGAEALRRLDGQPAEERNPAREGHSGAESEPSSS